MSTTIIHYSSFTDMLHALSENGTDMIVGKRVKDRLAVTAVLHKRSLLEYAELMRDCGHAHSDKRGDIAYAKLRLEQRIQYLDAGAVTEYLVKLSKVEKKILVRHDSAYFFYGILVNVMKLALGDFFFVIRHHHNLTVSVCTGSVMQTLLPAEKLYPEMSAICLIVTDTDIVEFVAEYSSLMLL